MVNLDALEGAAEKVGIAGWQGADWVVVSLERDVDLEGVQIPNLDRQVVGTTEQGLTVCMNEHVERWTGETLGTG